MIFTFFYILHYFEKPKGVVGSFNSFLNLCILQMENAFVQNV